MIKYFLFFISFLCIQNTFGQVTFVVDSLPENTPKNAAIYISGDFEGWTGGQEKYKLSQKGDQYSITLPKQEGVINFLFTQGSWKIVEKGIEGNRTYTYRNKIDTIKIQISNWEDNSTKKSTAAKNVVVLSEDFYMPELDRKRKIRIYLPPDYDAANKKYPVMYMHDGQNLFDYNTSFAGEWEVDETLNKLYQENGFGLIVIGIDNGGNKRMDEYSPWKIGKYGGGEGDAYVEFIVKTLKPYVDKNYRTKPERENTAIIGSSMGGLISHYAGLKYPDTFGVVGAFSPSFWLSDSCYDFATNHSDNHKTKMYFLAGDNESETMVSNLDKMIELMKANGFNKENIKSKIVLDGEHNEKLWRENFEETILWLFN